MAVESPPKVRSQCEFGQLPLVLALLALAGCPAGCKQKPADQDTSSATQSGDVVLLRGSFQAVAKPAKGTAEIVRSGEQYRLKLTQVSVESSGPVHVYLVGLPSAPNTIVVDEVDMKYDMAALTPAVPEQLIDLPSEPDSALRSVVLWDPRYGANLASANLSAVK